MPATYETLLGIDDALARKGHHRLTPWWRETLRRLYEHRSATTFVGRVGRGGIKSGTSVKVSLNEVLCGDWAVPPGEVHFWAYVSATKDEAAQRLRLIQRCLSDLGIPHVPADDQIVLRDMPLGWRVFAAQIGAVSGFRCVGYSADELAKWKAADRLSNPASEVCASLAAMTVTHAGARKILISSPMARLDYHFERFELGCTRDQVVADAPTWVANPSVTEEQTHALEPDRRVWLREYAAVPQANTSAAFDSDAIDEAFELRPTARERGLRVIVLDPSSGRKDAWTWGIAGWAFPQQGPSVLQFDLIDGIEGGFFKSVSSDDVVKRIVNLAQAENIRYIHSDQREAFTLQSAFSRHGLGFTVHDWTSSSKPEAVEKLRRWFAEARVALPEHRKLKLELLSFEERITATGAFTFGARGSGHDDYVALLLTAVMAIGELGNNPRTMYDQLSRIYGPRPGEPGSLGLNEPPLPRDAERGTRWRSSPGRGFG